MGLVCCVKHCKNTSRKASKAISFHALPPHSNGPLRKKWLCGLQLTEADVHYKYPTVCSTHFQPGEIWQAGQHRKVRKNAVPSLVPLQNMIKNEACTNTPVNDLEMSIKCESPVLKQEQWDGPVTNVPSLVPLHNMIENEACSNTPDNEWEMSIKCEAPVLKEEQWDGPISIVPNERDEEIMALKMEIRLLQEKLQKSEKRIKFLERKYTLLKEETKSNRQWRQQTNKQVTDGKLNFPMNRFVRGRP